jgi:mono/diheme cytochrome c family protein
MSRIIGVLVLLFIAAAGVFFALAHKSEIASLPASAETKFDPALVARGATLAQIGNCNICHTAPGGQPFAGGLALPTPFGTIHSTNITPDRDTGIGAWPEEAFIRAMREGVDREGNHLYPAFPYDHFTKVSDDDNRALYAFLMTRDAVRAEAQANDLPFPLTWRPLLAGWNMLFLREGAYQDDPTQSAEWNRGAYLAEGIGHCGACHTPRNLLGAEKANASFAGGEAEGWYAYALNRDSPAPVPWTVDALSFYLQHGWHELHGISRGAMAPVTTNLASVPDADVRALAVYIASRMGEPTPARRQHGEAIVASIQNPAPEGRAATADSQTQPSPASNGPANDGAAIYAAACSSCHDNGRALPYGGINLHLSTAVSGPNPDNIVNVVLFGLPPAPGEASPIMPGFHNVLNDGQLAALISHMRATFSDQPPWDNVDRAIADVRTGKRVVTVRPTDGASRAPVDPRAEEAPW